MSPRAWLLNYGLRWDFYGVIAEKRITCSADITNLEHLPSLRNAGRSAGLDGLYNPDKKDFSPRVSAVWDVTGKGTTVVRAGYGMFFDAFSQDMVLGHLPYPRSSVRARPTTTLGPIQIHSANANPNDFDVNGIDIPNTPIYGARPATSSAISFAFDRNIKTPYMENYNLNIQHQLQQPSRCSSGLCRFAGSPAVALLRPQSAKPGADYRLRLPVWRSRRAHRPAHHRSFAYRATTKTIPTEPFTSCRKTPPASPTTTRCRASFRVTGWHGIHFDHQLRVVEVAG